LNAYPEPITAIDVPMTMETGSGMAAVRGVTIQTYSSGQCQCQGRGQVVVDVGVEKGGQSGWNLQERRDRVGEGVEWSVRRRRNTTDQTQR
jgi:hypothetical protein